MLFAAGGNAHLRPCGLNLYYRALKGTAWKWLDLPALFAKILQPHHDIQKVKYFTARVSGTPADPSKPQRQDVHDPQTRAVVKRSLRSVVAAV